MPQISRGSGIGPLHLAIDSPPIGLGGLKVFGEGEWKIKLHGKDTRILERCLSMTPAVSKAAMTAFENASATVLANQLQTRATQA